MIVSGSHDSTVAALLFEEDGTMCLSLTNTAKESDLETITLMTDYFQYALSREDWLLSFIDQIIKTQPVDESDKDLKTYMRSHLRVIEGGKSDTSGSH